MSRLRGYQVALKNGIYEAWNSGARAVVAATATGSGKTYTMSAMAHELAGLGLVQAHRSELVGQISMAFANDGLRHNITAAKSTIKAIVSAHMDEYGRSFYDPRANWNIASVDTLIRRVDPLAAKVNYVFTDEGHHVLKANKWGRAVDMYPNAKVLLMTATPTRADGMGLGSHADGIADALVIGPGLYQLIAEGYLTPYDVYAPTVADLDLSDVHVTASGEFNQQEAARAIKKSRKIVGDVVEHYLTRARGKLGITFAVDIEHAGTITNAFNAAGVPAALVTADTEESERRAIMKRFKARELLQLVNVDLFGEGVDVPAVECVSMARPTASFSLYAQQVGRMLRLLISPVLMAAWDTYSVEQRRQFIAESPKPFGILLDHVGNVRREYNVGGIKYSGLPEGFTAWTLDRRNRRARGPADDAIPLRKCLNHVCHKDYERIYDACPYCGTAAPLGPDRSSPELVDGNLEKLDGEVLRRMRGEIARIDAPPIVPAAAQHVASSVRAAHQKRQAAQFYLREAIDAWAGMWHTDPDNVNYARFFHTFGMDVLTACALGEREAQTLKLKIDSKLLGTA